ncbi:hypothetical protein WICPIJ_008165 [Wickerhamomyces pijperi]|uniref:RFX-type winged-helix domain-containing protein n=1 Tax=Wickerhamomyces pijperi TaxID=599730 RepID=A0A9P8PYA1_WICPI|nr:hypothetical protein WICPIJ_008165 [Wickerhamomyces pijperi]
MTTNENEELNYVLENVHLNKKEFLKKIPDAFKRSKHHETKIISLYIIKHLFKEVQDDEANVPKTEAYELYQQTMKSQNLCQVNNISQFGKLLSLLFRDSKHFKIRRIGSRSSTRYCYFGISFRDPETSNLKTSQKTIDARTALTCIDKTIRFRYLNSNNKFSAVKNYRFNRPSKPSDPLIIELDELFRSFLTDTDLNLSQLIFRSHVPNLIFKCFQNSNVFIKEIDTKMFRIMHQEFEDLNLFDTVIVKQLEGFEKNEALSKVKASLNFFFQDEENSDMQSFDYSFLKNYFNIVIDSSYNINTLKLKIVNFILQILKAFNYENFASILLNFKHLTSCVLRELSVNRKSTFTLYWYLLCSMDELIRVVLEYYALKRLKS